MADNEVEVELREDGPAQYRNRSGVHADEDNPRVSVSPDHAAYLVDETGYFKFVDPDPRIEAADASADDGGGDADDGGDDPPDEAEDSYAFDADTWFDDHDDYKEREERVLSGDVDEHLGEIAEIETSENVADAVGVRRAELEE